MLWPYLLVTDFINLNLDGLTIILASMGRTRARAFVKKVGFSIPVPKSWKTAPRLLFVVWRVLPVSCKDRGARCQRQKCQNHYEQRYPFHIVSSDLFKESKIKKQSLQEK
jgi:hypothetical protein